MKTFVPDTSVVIEGIVRRMLEEGKIKEKLVIPNAVIAELEHQAGSGREVGLIGLGEINKIRELCKEKGVEFSFYGERPTEFQVKKAKIGEIDALIRRLAVELKGVLITNDLVQAESGKAYGIEVVYEKKEERKGKLLLEEFFDERTMSIHLKEGVEPKAKKGVPGNCVFEKIREEKMGAEEVKKIGTEIINEARISEDSFIEIQRRASVIVQLKDYRIVITKRPFSNSFEITAVTPIKKMNLEDYKIDKKLLERFEKKAEGILIAGAPGMGKTTFAQALAEFYFSKNKIIKTLEAPRDMKLPLEITQYSKNFGTSDEIRDILLLSRPDYTIFDEMRNTKDFNLFSDLRLSGIGMVGVLHATTPIDAIQRFIGRLDLGVIPSVIDTVVFIENGKVNKVFELKLGVRVPTGMVEKDLARPIIEVSDFLTKELEFELYVFGEETVVIPVKQVEGGSKKEIDFQIDLRKRIVSFILGEGNEDSNIEVKVGRAVYKKKSNEHGEVQFSKKSQKGVDILRSLKKGVRIKVYRLEK